MTLTDFFSNAFILTLFSLLKELITFVLYRWRSETQVWLRSHSKGLGVKNRNSGPVSLSSKLAEKKNEVSKDIFLYACVYKYLPIFLLPRNHC